MKYSLHDCSKCNVGYMLYRFEDDTNIWECEKCGYKICVSDNED